MRIIHQAVKPYALIFPAKFRLGKTFPVRGVPQTWKIFQAAVLWLGHQCHSIKHGIPVIRITCPEVIAELHPYSSLHSYHDRQTLDSIVQDSAPAPRKSKVRMTVYLKYTSISVERASACCLGIKRHGVRDGGKANSHIRIYNLVT